MVVGQRETRLKERGINKSKLKEFEFFCFRVDASIKIGTGHVYRCLSIAEQIKETVKVVFICRELTGHLIDLIESKGFDVIRLPAVLKPFDSDLFSLKLKHASWLEGAQNSDAMASAQALLNWSQGSKGVVLVDHFALDTVWETDFLQRTAWPIWVLDGQADRMHSAQALIDPTACSVSKKWVGLLSKSTSLYQGAAFAPINKAFFDAKKLATIRTTLKTILISFGGVDINDYTQRTLNVLLGMLLPDLNIIVVVGKGYPHLCELKKQCDLHSNIQYFVQTDDLPSLLLKADLAIGAGGIMTWERCLLGLPSLTAVIADNQRQQVDCLANKGVLMSLGSDCEQLAQNLEATLKSVLNTPTELSKMSKAAFEFAQDLRPNQWLALFRSLCRQNSG